MPASRPALAALVALVTAAGTAGAQQWEAVAAPTTTSLRGVSTPNDSIVWVSGARGAVARSIDAGATWQLVPVPGADSLDFRDIEAFDARTATVLSIGPGDASRIYRTTDGGQSWALQFRNADTTAFYDCFSFWSPARGLAMSDPGDGRFRILRTVDGGATWTLLPAADSPTALPGEAGFAASGTCVATAAGGHAWIATGGGPRARALHSADHGATWSASDIAPIAAGAAPRGAFSIAAASPSLLVATGGDYERPTDAVAVVARSLDGGARWQPVDGRAPGGYRSGVAFVPDRGGRVLVAVGTSGTDYSIDGGRSWMAADTLPLNAVAFASSRAGWAVGPRGTVARWRGGFPPARVPVSGKARQP